jgi:nucleoside-diphosphate-sugar epimerase
VADVGGGGPLDRPAAAIPAGRPPAGPARVLLTGATGRVGARFLPLLRAAGAELRLAVWSPAGRPGPANPALVTGDLIDPDVCRRAVAGMDAVVHLASAFVGVTAGQAEALNYRATRALAAAALAAGVRQFVQLSSYLVYRPAAGRPAREGDRLRAPDGPPFAAAKLGSERAVAELAGTGLAVCVLRLAFTYGEGDPHLAEAVGWARSAPAGRRLHLVHHADVRQAVLRCLRAGTRGTFNIADDAPVPPAELLAVTADLPPRLREPARAEAGRNGPAGGPGELAGGPGELAGEVDTTAARTGLGFAPGYPSIRTARQAGAI